MASLTQRNSEAARAWAAKRRELRENAPLRSTNLKSAQAVTRSPVRRNCESDYYREMPTRPTIPSTRRDHHPTASSSHEENVKYMEEFHVGMAEMYLALEEECPNAPRRKLGLAQDLAYLSRNTGLYHASASARTRSGLSLAPGYRFKPARAEIWLAPEQGKDTTGGVVAAGWYSGPRNPAGQLIDLSDRNLLCMSVSGDEAVFGCADHSLYYVDTSKGLETRRLYGSRSNPSAGHREWVTSVAHTAQGDVISGGMDGKLCLWSSQCSDTGEIQAHAGSISTLKADVEGRAITCGYGGSLKIWDCRRRRGSVRVPKLAGELFDARLPAPCMDFAWDEGRVVTAHRDGSLGVYDLETSVMVLCRQGAHRGHVTTITSFSPRNTLNSGGTGCFVTGGQDGFLRMWDPRVGELGTQLVPSPSSGRSRLRPIMETPAHRGSHGVGAVGGVIPVGSTGTRLVSFGADRRICILEARGGRGFERASRGAQGDTYGTRTGAHQLQAQTQSAELGVEHVFDDHRDFIYCMDFIPASGVDPGGSLRGCIESDHAGGVLVSGGGDGMVLLHDLVSMRLLYGLGCCSKGAVRCIIAQEGKLTVGGDDGNAMIYQFNQSNDAKSPYDEAHEGKRCNNKISA